GPNMIQRPGKRKDAPGTDQAVGRLQADDPAISGGQTDGAGGIGADGAIAHGRSHGGARAGRRATSDVCGVPGIPGWTKMPEQTAASVGELVQIQFAQEHSSGLS